MPNLTKRSDGRFGTDAAGGFGIWKHERWTAYKLVVYDHWRKGMDRVREIRKVMLREEIDKLRWVVNWKPLPETVDAFDRIVNPPAKKGDDCKRLT